MPRGRVEDRLDRPDPDPTSAAGLIQVRVMLFGVYGEMGGTRECRVSLAAGSRVTDIVKRLRETPGLQLPDQPVVAVNRVYADPDAMLSEGDEVALIPPVAGG